MNSDTRMPAALQARRRSGADGSRPRTTSSPPSVVRSSRFSGTRQQACGTWRSAMAEHLVGGGHLEVERPRQLALEPGDVGIGDVAAVLAQVRGDAVGAGLDREVRGAQRIGMAAAARVADGGDVVDVDAEAQVAHVASLRHGSAAVALTGAHVPLAVPRSSRIARSLHRCSLRAWHLVEHALDLAHHRPSP